MPHARLCETYDKIKYKTMKVAQLDCFKTCLCCVKVVDNPNASWFKTKHLKEMNLAADMSHVHIQFMMILNKKNSTFSIYGQQLHDRVWSHYRLRGHHC